MSRCTCLSLKCLPMLLGIVMTVGMIVSFVIAIWERDVSPYVPFISETGAYPPESGIFSIFLYATSVLGLLTISARFMIVQECNQGVNKCISVLNYLSFAVGVISMAGMVVVAAYPMISIETAHMFGALTLFLAGLIYGYCQTWVTYKMHPCYNGFAIVVIRFVIILFSTAAFLFMTFVQPMARKKWGSTSHTHWTGAKTPIDKGFSLLVASASAEWAMAILFIFFFFTFVNEFSKVSFHLDVHLLVSHFDQQVLEGRGPNNERTTLL